MGIFLFEKKKKDCCEDNGDRLYVLKCEKAKYYIGKTTRDVTSRYEEHKQGKGSSWTRMYPPISLLEVRVTFHSLDEDQLTKQYMMEYGIDNVRGGYYSSLILDWKQKFILQKEFRHARNECLICGSRDHYAAQCDQKSIPCTRCNFVGHSVETCYRHLNSLGQEIKNLNY